ncbi:uncharacterized protein LOC114873775 isoform X1 [Osmia bicornis bicornis]|uniref:uncharacterized protein LOC114873775 isoform X1 n=1 Tax=Osmia bicornis bicornis TaxID=1437191 RepID=UPI0010F6ED4B|nr:uncharacterized protein LOC114873775 isoform X1 [Osmia bicornis bicornis]
MQRIKTSFKHGKLKGLQSYRSYVLGSCRSQECGHERLVKCGRPFERISNSDLSFATKKEDLQRLCPDFEAGIKCIQTYTFDCMKEKQREHFSSLYAGTNKVVMELCQDGPYQDEFLKHAPCMQKVQPEYELCSKKYHRTTQEIERSNHTVSLNASLKSLCCGFKEFLECSHHTVRRQCGDDTAQFAKEFLDRMSISLLKEHCGAYTEKVCSIGSDANTLRASTMVAVVLAVLARYFT